MVIAELSGLLPTLEEARVSAVRQAEGASAALSRSEARLAEQAGRFTELERQLATVDATNAAHQQVVVELEARLEAERTKREGSERALVEAQARTQSVERSLAEARSRLESLSGDHETPARRAGRGARAGAAAGRGDVGGSRSPRRQPLRARSQRRQSAKRARGAIRRRRSFPRRGRVLESHSASFRLARRRSAGRDERGRRRAARGIQILLGRAPPRRQPASLAREARHRGPTPSREDSCVGASPPDGSTGGGQAARQGAASGERRVVGSLDSTESAYSTALSRRPSCPHSSDLWCAGQQAHVLS